MKNKVVMILGQSGTFGTAMTQRLLTMDVKNIIGVARGEKNQAQNKRLIDDNRLIHRVADIRDKDAIENLISFYEPDIVMLAAAMKHVDKCEKDPSECMKTNINGAINVIDACIKYEVPKCVFLSTDKAANPTTIYGSSKDFVEKYIQAVDSKNTTLLTTRYGNVLGSNGSVLEIWRDLKKQGKPLTVTNPDMTRFFMSIDQAIDLVLKAIEYGNDKDKWVFNNKSCTIGDLANAISDYQIVTGLRCVEKNDEALLTINELNKSDRIVNQDGEILYYQYNKENPTMWDFEEPLTSENAERLTKEELQELIDGV